MSQKHANEIESLRVAVARLREQMTTLQNAVEAQAAHMESTYQKRRGRKPNGDEAPANH